MGEVYEARRRDLGDRVALKLLHRHESDDPELRARFLREARALAQVASPHVVRIVDFQANPGEVAFLAMEYLQGQNAGELLRLRGPFSAREVLPLAKQMFAGLAAMHALGLVHRDIKPQNLMIVDGGPLGPILKIVDFGLAKDTSSGERSLPDHASILGTPSFMAPEQVGGNATVDARADVYGAAATFIALATGKTLYEDRGGAVIAAILAGRRLPVAAVASALGAPLCATLERALAADRTMRHARIEELGAEVERGLLALGSGTPATFAVGRALDSHATVTDRSQAAPASVPSAQAPSLHAPFPWAPSLNGPPAPHAPGTHHGYTGPSGIAPQPPVAFMPGTNPPGSMRAPPSLPGTYPPGSMHAPLMRGPTASTPMQGPPPPMPGYSSGSLQPPHEASQRTSPPGALQPTNSAPHLTPIPSSGGRKGVVIGVAVTVVTFALFAAGAVGLFLTRTTEDPPDAAATPKDASPAAATAAPPIEATERDSAAPSPGTGRPRTTKPASSAGTSDGGAQPTPSATSPTPTPPPPVGDATRMPIRCTTEADCPSKAFCDKEVGMCTCSRGKSAGVALIYCNGQCIDQDSAHCGGCNTRCNSATEACAWKNGWLGGCRECSQLGSSYRACGGRCSNTDIEAFNCGGCGKNCITEPECRGKACSCRAGRCVVNP